MKRQIIYLLALTALIAVTGCGSSPSESQPDPTYVSPTAYKHYNCKQIGQERARVSKKIDILIQTDATSQVLNTAVTAFAISQGYRIGGGNGGGELQRLKNQEEVLEQTAIEKNCN